VGQDPCIPHYKKQTLGRCTTPVSTADDCIEAARDFNYNSPSIFPSTSLTTIPSGCQISISGEVIYNSDLNTRNCDLTKFCICRDSPIQCRTPMEKPLTASLTPPHFHQVSGIFSHDEWSTPELTKNVFAKVVSDSTPFHTQFVTRQAENSFKEVVVTDSLGDETLITVPTSPLFYLSDTGRTIFTQQAPLVPQNFESEYTYKRITDATCGLFGWAPIDSAEECSIAAAYLRRFSEQMPISAESGGVFVAETGDKPKGCYHTHTTLGRLWYNPSTTSTTDCSGVEGCICKKKLINNYMVRETGYCTDLAGWTVIPTIPECDFAAKNIPEYIATLGLEEGVIRNIEQLNTVGILHKIAPPGCYMKNQDLNGLEEISLLFNMDVNPQGELNFLPSVYNDNHIMKKCSSTEVCICKRAPYKTIDSGRCDDIAGWQNIEDRPTPSTLDTHDFPGECRKAIEHLSSNSNLLSLAMNMGTSDNPQISGLFPNMGYVSHITDPVTPDVNSINLLNHMGGTFDVGFKPAGCSIGTGSSNAAYSYNRGTREEVFTMVEYDGKEYARQPYASNAVSCDSGRQCVCKRVPEYRRVCATCDGNEPVCLEFQNIDKVTQMEIDWNVPGVYPLGIFSDWDQYKIPEYALEIYAKNAWKIGEVTYTELTRSDAPAGRGVTYEYLVKRTPNFVTVFAETNPGPANLGNAHKCNDVLTTQSKFTVERFTKEKSVPDLQKRVSTSGNCANFNYDVVSCADDGSCLCARKEVDMYKEITSGFCEKEKGWLPITSKSDCEAVLLLTTYSGFSIVSDNNQHDRPSGCFVYDWSIGQALLFNTYDSTRSHTPAHSLLRSICKRASYNPVIVGSTPKKWNDLAVMDLQHFIVPDFEVAVREMVDRPVYDDTIIFREWDGNPGGMYNEYVFSDEQCSGDFMSLTSAQECGHILTTYEFHALDDWLPPVENTGTVDPFGCSVKRQATTGATIRFNTNSNSPQNCGSFLSSGGTWKYYKCLCKLKRFDDGNLIDEMIVSDNLKNGFRPSDNRPTRDISIPIRGCDGDGCVELICPTGYTGESCDIDINECDPDPCQNSAVCSESGTNASVLLGEYHCECAAGFTGTNCEEDIDECNAIPTTSYVTHARVDDASFGTSDDFTSSCEDVCQARAMVCNEQMFSDILGASQGLSGVARSRCQIQVDVFLPLYGLDAGGTLLADGSVQNQQTPPDWICSKCVQIAGEAERAHSTNPDCFPGVYYGENPQNTALTQNIFFWNAALDPSNGYTCATKASENVKNIMCECDTVSPCQNSAVCTETSDGITLTPGVYHCECPDGYNGTNCEEDINECEPDPCQNNATCTETSDGITLTPGVYHCECDVGYNGTNCEEDINECDPDPCLNGGVCLTVDDSYICACPPGYAGTNCEEDINECDPDPCQNGATCTQTSDGSTLTVGVYHCECAVGFTGTDCETTTPCDPHPCQNGAYCTEMTGNGNTGYTCTCPTGYSGVNCEEDINECDPDPCQNGATCTETLDGTTLTVGVYHCECVAGFEGYACHIEIPCAATPCQNGATCSEIIITDPAPTYAIIEHQNTCSSYGDGYRGLTADECANVPNTASMMVYGDGLGIHTYGACAYNGIGGTMIGVIDDSQPDLCFFASCACIKPSVEFTCDCLPGYDGTNCEEDINECLTEPCKNGASCTQGIGEYTCDCLLGYGGINCEIDTDKCSPDPCQNGATCTETTDGKYSCECLTGFEGLDCEVDVNECLLQPCQHGGICTETTDGTTKEPGVFHCACSSYFGYSGQLCNECEPGSGRADDGRCTECSEPQFNTVTTSTAPCADQECPEGFGVSSDNWDVLGGNCEECPAGEESMAGTGVCSNINECEPDPCQNGAICSETSDGITLTAGEYNCLCVDGFAGTNCEEDINECDPDPCQNGATCTQGIGEYTCECPTGYSGLNCEEDTNECDPDPCQNGATCTEGDIGEYSCTCEVGFQGENCEIDINECIVEPCQFEAVCKDSSVDISIAPGDFECDCVLAFGFTGQLCNECGAGSGRAEDGRCRPCEQPQINNVTSHSAPCADQECPENFGVSSDNWDVLGDNCEECIDGEESIAGSGVCSDINECDPDPCQNAATCTESGTSVAIPLGEYQCTCGAGFSGKNCEIDDKCLPSPCAPQTSQYCVEVFNMVLGGAEYYCKCSPGWAGQNCTDLIDKCEYEPCQNGACSSVIHPNNAALNSYNCECLPGYSGTNCDEDINECDPDPCQNGAVCTESGTDDTVLPGEYNCECTTGYEGTNCEEDTNECDPNPCQNEGVCTQGAIGEYQCECPTGYNGVDCEIDINECDALDPCQHGSHCKESNTYSLIAAGDFECECVLDFGFTGKLCNECQPGHGVSVDGRCTECEQPQINNVTTKTAPCADQVCPENYGVTSDSWDVLGSNCAECPVGSGSPAGSGVCNNINECDPDPCQNGATCSETVDGITELPTFYFCECATGYTGTNCEEDINECDPDPCFNGATCSETSDGITPGVGVYNCECADGFTGTKCEEDIDECDPDPCQNGATCTETFDGSTLTSGVYHCECPAGFAGTNCEEIINNCDPNQCQNDGACLSLPSGYQCTCSPGYSGTNCEIDTNECDPNPCLNSATCTETSDGITPGVGVYHCECVAGFAGTKCDEYVGICSTEPCQNGGNCLPEIALGEYTCDCLDGFEGLQCEVDVNECLLNPCLHGGICTETSDGITPTPGVFHCACSDYWGYDGKTCSECGPGKGRDNWNRCRPCENPLINNETTANTVCVDQACPEGYGVVSEAWNGIVSVCQLCPFGEGSPAAVSGVCQNINECDPDPCQNSGICSETSDGITPIVGEFFCLCQIGYEGTNCEEDINECDPDPCLNGATCTETVDGSITAIGVYHCECPTGHSGTNCETPEPCDPDPCQNGGACLTVDDSYMCACPPGYSGTNCEIDTNECDPDPCQNGGTCTETSDGTIQAVGVYHCDCLTGYTGDDCEVDTNECDPNPCQNGATCIQDIGEYTCECTTGYTGTNCEIDIDKCDPDPCKNGATCLQNIDGYTCECTTGYTGTKCEEDINECEDVNICGDKFCRNTVGSYVCDNCDIGEHYHSDTDSCYQNTCVCENGVASSPCNVEGFESCQNCDFGFKLMGNKCIEQSRELEEEEEMNWGITVLIVLLLLAVLFVGFRWFSSPRSPVVVAVEPDPESQALLDRKINLIF